MLGGAGGAGVDALCAQLCVPEDGEGGLCSLNVLGMLEVLEVLEVPEVIRCVPLCMLAAVEGEL